MVEQKGGLRTSIALSGRISLVKTLLSVVVRFESSTVDRSSRITYRQRMPLCYCRLFTVEWFLLEFKVLKNCDNTQVLFVSRVI